MRASIRLGRALGVDISLHYSWFILAGLFVVGLSGRFREAAPFAAPGWIWLAATATALAFFGGLLLHELSHVAAARASGLSVRGVTLFALGGVADSAEEPRDPGSELLIGIVGPITSAALAGAFMAAAALLGRPESAGAAIVKAAFSWLAGINLALAAFNLLPAYPMDGGRVLRAAIWRATGSRGRATRMAAAGGQIIAGLLVFLGALGFARGGGFGSLWLAFIGLFIYQAAAASAWSAGAADALRRLRVGDVMSSEVPAASPEETLQSVVDDKMLRRGKRCVVVSRGGRLLGLVTTREVKRVAKGRWRETPVRRAMVPANRVRTVSPAATVYDALELMGREGVSQLPVVGDDGLVGVLTRADAARALQARRELGDGRA